MQCVCFFVTGMGCSQPAKDVVYAGTAERNRRDLHDINSLLACPYALVALKTVAACACRLR
jgi:hypothetical protein